MAALGAGAGFVGTFALLRKVSMIGDVVSHAALPGTAIAFLLSIYLTLTPNIIILFSGAAIISALVALIVYKLINIPKISEDLAIATAIGGSFGSGVLLLSIIQSHKLTQPSIDIGNFILGDPSRLTLNDAIVIIAILIAVFILSLLNKRAFIISSFDPEAAKIAGYSTEKIDQTLILLLILIAIAAMMCIGIILTIALITINPIAARLWSHNINKISTISASFGAISGHLGASISASSHNTPTSSTIVLISSIILALSIAFAPHSKANIIYKINKNI